MLRPEPHTPDAKAAALAATARLRPAVDGQPQHLARARERQADEQALEHSYDTSREHLREFVEDFSVKALAVLSGHDEVWTPFSRRCGPTSWHDSASVSTRSSKHLAAAFVRMLVQAGLPLSVTSVQQAIAAVRGRRGARP